MRPARHLGADMVMDGGFVDRVAYVLRSRDAGEATRLSFVSAACYTHPVAWLMSPLITPKALAKMRSDLATPKAGGKSARRSRQGYGRRTLESERADPCAAAARLRPGCL